MTQEERDAFYGLLAHGYILVAGVWQREEDSHWKYRKIFPFKKRN